MRRLSCVCALLVGAGLWSAPARADGAVDVSLNLGHGLPGTTVHVVVAPGCDATGVHLALSGRSAAADETGTTGSEADAQTTASGSWEADLVVAPDLAAPQSPDVVATVTCTGSSAPTTGQAPFAVDAWDSQQVAVDRGQARPGDHVAFTTTGGRGSCWKAYVDDAAGARWWVYDEDPYPGARLTAQTNGSSDGLSGTFLLDARMAVGAATLTVHCSQAVDRPARVDVLAAATATAPATTAAGEVVAPTVAGPTSAGPSVPADRRTGSRISLGGGAPVVSPTPVVADPRFPLPVLAPPIQGPAVPHPVVVAAVPAASRAPWLGWPARLGLLAVPVLGMFWGITRRRGAR